jgi:hypothetical protein
MKFRILLAILLFSTCLTGFAQSQITGIWGIDFDSSMNTVSQKLISRGVKSSDIHKSPTNIVLEGSVRFASENFDGCCFFFDKDQFKMVVFNKAIQYEDAFTTHLTYKQAEQWLANNRYKVNQVLSSLKSDLVAKYGTPHLDREDRILWKSSNGNIIEIEIKKTLDIGSETGQPEMYSEYGAIPQFSIAVIIVQPQESL